ncbi:MAG: poly-gamma-glutamate biosynthesis protein [Bacteroides sp. SM23_62_1]|nr:MAG: poly-gamma-glutamate biosynthesis protein [Bacteroides sp. SM23_62_1]
MKDKSRSSSSGITLFLCGDVMTGRGLDQVLPHPVDPTIYESYVKDARDYILLAERVNGPINKPVSYSYIWGDAMEVWNKIDPTLKIINLETSITTHDQPWSGKGINYRMHPENIKVFTSAGIDFCSLANNHLLDWGREGLLETLQTLKDAGIACAGAGINLADAGRPAQFEVGQSRVIIIAYGSVTSGILKSWAASAENSGVNLLPGQDDKALDIIGKQVKSIKQPGDIVIFSVHWGSNWGYDIPGDQRSFAHALIDNAGVDIIHGHSSHHPRGIELYKDKLIIYGAGDFINDYEGISGYEQYRDDLTLMYFPMIDPSGGTLISMILVPMQIRKFRLNHVSVADARWLLDMLNREGRKLGTSAVLTEDGYYSLHWD